MTHRWLRTIALALTAGTLACAPAAEPDLGVGVNAGFDTWDMNDDGVLAGSEFGVGWEQNTFGVWDSDDDGFIGMNEWNTGVGAYDNEFGDFGVWDSNDDGLLSGWEFSNGSFGVFDDDASGFIDDDEWGANIGLWD